MDLTCPRSSIILDDLTKGGINYTSKTGKFLFFYCDFRLSATTSAHGVYGSLLSQLLDSNGDDDLPPDLKDYFEKNKSTPPPEGFLKEQLMIQIRRAGPIKILVDALDECVPAARIPVLETLMAIHETGSVSLLITSRPDADIKFILKEVPTVCINAAVNSHDIKLYVTEECDRNVKLKRKLKGSTKLEVISTITSQANGM